MRPASSMRARSRRQRGALLIEVMVSMLICAFGLLGFAAMQARAASAEFESLQRSQALVLMEDMVGRLNANRANADSYVGNALLGEGAVEDCTGLAGALLDLCEWGNLIRGSSESSGGVLVGSMPVARGCISRAADTSNRYIIAVAWQGVVATGAPPSDCGQGDAAFANDTLRRTVTSTVCVALLRDPAVVPALARC